MDLSRHIPWIYSLIYVCIDLFTHNICDSTFEVFIPATIAGSNARLAIHLVSVYRFVLRRRANDRLLELFVCIVFNLLLVFFFLKAGRRFRTKSPSCSLSMAMDPMYFTLTVAEPEKQRG